MVMLRQLILVNTTPSHFLTPSPWKPAGHWHFPSPDSWKGQNGLRSNRPIFSNKAIYHVTSPKPTWQAENVFPLRVSCQHPPWFIKHFPGPAAANNIGDYYELLYYLT